MRRLEAYGHAALMFGQLAIIFALAAVNSSLNPYSGSSVFLFAGMVWLIGIAFIAVEWVEGKIEP